MMRRRVTSWYVYIYAHELANQNHDAGTLFSTRTYVMPYINKDKIPTYMLFSSLYIRLHASRQKLSFFGQIWLKCSFPVLRDTKLVSLFKRTSLLHRHGNYRILSIISKGKIQCTWNRQKYQILTGRYKKSTEFFCSHKFWNLMWFLIPWKRCYEI